MSLLGSFEDEITNGEWSSDATESPFEFLERFTTTQQNDDDEEEKDKQDEMVSPTSSRKSISNKDALSRHSSVASLDDHNVIVGFEPGTLVDLFRSSTDENNDAEQHTDNDNNNHNDTDEQNQQELQSRNQEEEEDISSYGSEVEDVTSYGSNTILPSRDSSTTRESVHVHTKEMTVLLDDMIVATEGVCRNLNRLLDGDSLQGSDIEQSLLSDTNSNTNNNATTTQQQEELGEQGGRLQTNLARQQESSSSASVSSSSKPLSMIINSSLWDDDSSSILSLHSMDDAISRLQEELQQQQDEFIANSTPNTDNKTNTNNNDDDAHESVSVSSTPTTTSDDFEIVTPPPPSALLHPGDTSDLGLAAVIHDRSAFMNVANQLSSIPEDQECRTSSSCWYANFGECEWEQFRCAAKQVLDAVEPSMTASSSSRLPLPPIPPNTGKFVPQNANKMYVASQVLPEAFICPLCNDVVVGATTLSCGCPSSTVCTACWELHTATATASIENLSAGDNHNNTTDYCPCCHESVPTAVPCHAVDVAILRAVQHASTTSPSTQGAVVESLQLSYYYRLDHWRSEILRRRKEENSIVREKILSQMIQNEEELLWKNKNDNSQRRRNKQSSNTTTATPFWKTRGFSAVGEIAILLLATSLGVGMVAKRRGKIF